MLPKNLAVELTDINQVSDYLLAPAKVSFSAGGCAVKLKVQSLWQFSKIVAEYHRSEYSALKAGWHRPIGRAILCGAKPCLRKRNAP
jgi:hypothetical protein